MEQLEDILGLQLIREPKGYKSSWWLFPLLISNNRRDNFIKYMLDVLQPEMTILGARTALKDFKLPIQHRKLKHFTTLYKEYGDMVLGQ